MLDPLPSYSPGSSLCVYYEIYSLKRNGDNVSKYRVTWSVASDDPGEGDAGVWSWIKASVRGSVPEPGIYISSSIDQSASTRSVGEDLELDVSILAPGRYVLILEIEDLVAKSVTSGSRRFAIIPRTGT